MRELDCKGEGPQNFAFMIPPRFQFTIRGLLLATFWVAAAWSLFETYKGRLPHAPTAALWFAGTFSLCIAIWSLFGRRGTWVLVAAGLILAILAVGLMYLATFKDSLTSHASLRNSSVGQPPALRDCVGKTFLSARSADERKIQKPWRANNSRCICCHSDSCSANRCLIQSRCRDVCTIANPNSISAAISRQRVSGGNR